MLNKLKDTSCKQLSGFVISESISSLNEFSETIELLERGIITLDEAKKFFENTQKNSYQNINQKSEQIYNKHRDEVDNLPLKLKLKEAINNEKNKRKKGN
jgi:exonuclease VII small subunit